MPLRYSREKHLLPAGRRPSVEESVPKINSSEIVDKMSTDINFLNVHKFRALLRENPQHLATNGRTNGRSVYKQPEMCVGNILDLRKCENFSSSI